MAGLTHDRVLAAIVADLAPLIGANMARSATRLHCEKLQLTAEKWDENDVGRLLLALTPGLNVFVGKHRTADVLHRIRRGLEIAVL